jgi:LasA protease
MNPASLRTTILLLITVLLVSACGNDLWGTYAPNMTPKSQSTIDATLFGHATDTKAPPLTPQASSTELPTVAFQATNTRIQATNTVLPGTPQPTIIYNSQSGDNLEAIASHYGVNVSEITSVANLSTAGLLNPNTVLVIPNKLAQATLTPSTHIIPDSEVLYSNTAVGFDYVAYIQNKGGKLSTYREAYSSIISTGTDDIQRMAFGSSISPRILLALIDHYTGWVVGPVKPGLDNTYPLGYLDNNYQGLYQQMRLMVDELLAGYYGWRDGTLTELTFQDGITLRLAPDLNAGTVALQFLFSKHLNYTEWLNVIDPNTGFPAQFTAMFGDPWQRAQMYGPLFPPDLTQPTLSLPFEPGKLWSLTGGPHPAWEQVSTWAALDFAPASDQSGCVVSDAWVVAMAPGVIVRSAEGYVVLDLDRDGYEETGWNVLYLHIATKDRITVGKLVNAGDRIGHPSCEGGEATGTHVHIARKYNGEWVAAGGPLPFVMSGYTAHAGNAPYKGTLTKGDKTISANQTASGNSHIIRKTNE